MVRPRSDNPRRHQLNVSFTDAEIEIVQRRSDAAGLRLVEFARAAILHHQLVVRSQRGASTEQRLALEELKRVGNNLNQISRNFNAMAIVPGSELVDVLTEIRILINRGAS